MQENLKICYMDCDQNFINNSKFKIIVEEKIIESI